MTDITKLRRLGTPPSVEEARMDLVPEAPAGQGGLLPEAVAVVRTMEAVVPAPDRQVFDLKPVREMPIERRPINHRVPIDVAYGLKTMAEYTGQREQDLLTNALTRMLDDWHPKWRDALPQIRRR